MSKASNIGQALVRTFEKDLKTRRKKKNERRSSCRSLEQCNEFPFHRCKMKRQQSSAPPERNLVPLNAVPYTVLSRGEGATSHTGARNPIVLLSLSSNSRYPRACALAGTEVRVAAGHASENCRVITTCMTPISFRPPFCPTSAPPFSSLNLRRDFPKVPRLLCRQRSLSSQIKGYVF